MKIYIFSFFEIYCSISLIACEYFLNSTMPFSSFNMTHPLLLLWWKFGTMARQRKPTLVQLRVISQPSIRLNRDQPDRNQSFVASFGIGRSSIMRSFPFSFECSIFPKRVAQRQGTRSILYLTGLQSRMPAARCTTRTPPEHQSRCCRHLRYSIQLTGRMDGPGIEQMRPMIP